MACPSCRRPLRFIEVPDRRCACGATVPLPPGQAWVRCRGCGRALAADARRTVRHAARCPRCRRRIDVDGAADEWVCPHCQAHLTLHDTF